MGFSDICLIIEVSRITMLDYLYMEIRLSQRHLLHGLHLMTGNYTNPLCLTYCLMNLINLVMNSAKWPSEVTSF